MKDNDYKKRRGSANRKRKKTQPKSFNGDKEIMATNQTNVDKYNLRVNDPDWYIYDPVMFDGVISMPTLDFKGVNAPWPKPGGNFDIVGSDANATLQAPTVVAYSMNPSASVESVVSNGYPNSSAVNVQARMVYNELSSSTAKTANYGPQDVSTLMLALGQIIAMANFLKRAYGITNYFNFYNRSIPKAMLHLHGMNSTGINQWITHMPELRARVNAVIAQINTIRFPGNFDYFKKCAYIYNNVFVDRDDKMPTYMFMVPESTWVVDETTDPEGTRLNTLEVIGNVYTRTTPIDFVLMLEMMVERVLTSTTYNYIYADVINLASRKVINEDFIHIDMLPIDYVIEPLYSEQFNWQVMNMSILGTPDSAASTEITGATASNGVYPDANNLCIRYNPTWTITTSVPAYANAHRPLPIRIPDIDVSKDEFVEMLAYYNYAYETINEAKTKLTVQYAGLTDYYCTRVNYTKGASYASHIGISSNFINDSNVMNYIPHMLNVVHAPILGAVYTSTGALKILSKLGAYTFTDFKALENLRYQTFLGLMKFKSK